MSLLPTHQIAEAVFVADNHITPEETRFFDEIVRFPLGEGAGKQSTALMDPEAAAKLVYAPVPTNITVQDVSFAYSARTAKIFENVSVTLKTGNLYVLIGPNGSGKTTFVKLLSGTILPQRGQLLYGSEKFNAKKSNVRYTALAFQNPDYQWTTQSVRSELSKVLGVNNLDGVSSPRREVLSAFGVPDEFMDQNPIELPFAIKKRLSVSLALLAGKPWVVLDEPTLGQDLTFRLALARLIETVLKLGVGIIVISHDAYFRSVFARREELLFGNRRVSRCMEGVERSSLSCRRYPSKEASRGQG
jgi:energy-coupling factor transporter ATP-binding protein EcfA2